MGPDNPPAFPCAIKGAMGSQKLESGMSLRDWFAGHALPAVMRRGVYGSGVGRDETLAAAAFAAASYQIADAMLAERAKATGAS